MLPLLHFTYADPGGDLSHIKRERKTHQELLVPRFLKGDYIFFQNIDFNQRDLNFGFEDYLSDVTVFHFSGHAGMGEIILDDGAAYITGITRQLKRILTENPLNKLVLVFLNGCSTGYMVDALLGAGVPVVIGTSAPVNDRTAADFSIHFYRYLIRGKTIGQSFDYALGKLETTTAGIDVVRGARVAGMPDDLPLWGMFYSDGKRHLINWRLNDKTAGSRIPEDGEPYEINALIRGALYHALLVAGAPEIIGLERRRQEGEDIDESINASLLLGLPGPISFHLGRLLRVEEDKGDLSRPDLHAQHLNNIYSVYQSLLELVFIIMLSQLWELCLGDNQEGDEPRLPVDFRKISTELEQLKCYFQSTRQERKFFDFIPMIRAIRYIFDKARKCYFVEELEHLKHAFEQDQDLIDCYRFFDGLRSNLNPKNEHYKSFSPLDWQQKCELAEKHLAYFFEAIAFCCRYEFAILKNIELLLPRHKSRPSYTYQLLKIPKNGNTRYKPYAPQMEGFTSVKSVVMLKSSILQNGEKSSILPPFTPPNRPDRHTARPEPFRHKLTGQINLYPFLVDNNVHDVRSEKGDLLFYSHFDRSTNSYCYEEAFRMNSLKNIPPGDIMYDEINDAFETIWEILFNGDLV